MIATMVMAAVSDLRILFPNETGTKPASLAIPISSRVKPPSGPTMPTNFFAGGNAFSTLFKSCDRSCSHKMTLKTSRQFSFVTNLLKGEKVSIPAGTSLSDCFAEF
jgi:hypothetical protein